MNKTEIDILRDELTLCYEIIAVQNQSIAVLNKTITVLNQSDKVNLPGQLFTVKRNNGSETKYFPKPLI
jgi:hypothetical protein